MTGETYRYDEHGQGVLETQSITVASLPGSNMRLLGALAGIPIVESPYLKYDEMYIGTSSRAIVVGEARHFMYRMRQIDLNQACRESVARMIEETASRILGEDWKVSPR